MSTACNNLFPFIDLIQELGSYGSNLHVRIHEEIIDAPVYATVADCLDIALITLIKHDWHPRCSFYSTKSVEMAFKSE